MSSSGTGLAAAISATAVASCSSQKVRAVAGDGPGSTTPVGPDGCPGVKSRRSSGGPDEEDGSPAPPAGATSTRGCSSASRSAPTRRSRSSRDRARMAVASASREVSPTKDENITSLAVWTPTSWASKARIGVKCTVWASPSTTSTPGKCWAPTTSASSSSSSSLEGGTPMTGSSSATAVSTNAEVPVEGDPAIPPAWAPIVGCPAFSPISPGAGEASSGEAEVADFDVGGATKSATTTSTKPAPVEDMTARRGERRRGQIEKRSSRRMLRRSTARACTYAHSCATPQAVHCIRFSVFCLCKPLHSSSGSGSSNMGFVWSHDLRRTCHLLPSASVHGPPVLARDVHAKLCSI